MDKVNTGVFSALPGSKVILDNKAKELFDTLTLEEQVNTIANIILYLKSNRAGSCDASNIGGAPKAGFVYLSANISNWKYNDIRIIDQSATGLFESKSINLKELL